MDIPLCAQDDSQTIEEIKNDFDIGKSDFDMTKQRQQALRIDVQSLFLIGNVCEPTPVPMSPNHIEEPIHRGLGRGAGPSSIVFG